MLTRFSSKYYLGQVEVDASSVAHAGEQTSGVMARDEYEVLHNEIYGQTITQAPVVVKIDNRHILVEPDESVRRATIEVDKSIIDELQVEPPSVENVMVATEQAVSDLLDINFLPSQSPSETVDVVAHR